MIELVNVSKTYPNGVTAIENINFKINDGDIFGIIGLSGAGKSTLVRCINALEKPSTGKVYIDNVHLAQLNDNDLNHLRMRIGMIFQNYALLEQRTVYENVRFPLELNHTDKKEAAEKVKSLLDLVGLINKVDSYPSQLSGGQKQRVAIARALANTPSYLLCDEVTSALDPKTTDSILELLLDINRKLGITIIVISHDMHVIYSICQKVAVLDNSHIVEQGTVEEIFNSPQSEIAKRLLRLRKLEANNHDQ